RLVGDDPLDQLVASGHAVLAPGSQHVSVRPSIVADALRDAGAALTVEQARLLVELDPQARADVLVTRRLAAGEEPAPAEIEQGARVAWAAGDPHRALSLAR